MTKKITFTLEESLIETLTRTSVDLGKKKSQILREALKRYLNDVTKERQMQAWTRENKEAIEHYNERVEEHGVFSNTLRRF